MNKSPLTGEPPARPYIQIPVNLGSCVSRAVTCNRLWWNPSSSASRFQKGDDVASIGLILEGRARQFQRAVIPGGLARI